MADLGSGKGNVQIRGSRLDGCYRAIQFHGDQGEALASLRHGAQELVVLLGPSFIVLTGKHLQCRQGQEAGPRCEVQKGPARISPNASAGYQFESGLYSPA